MIELSWIVVLKFWLYDANLCRSQNYLGTIWRPGVYFSLNIDGVILGPMVGWDFQESNSDFKYFLIVEIGNHLFSTCLTSLTFDLYMLRIGASEEAYLQLYYICIYIMKKCITAWGFYCTYVLSSLRKECNIILSSDFTAADINYPFNYFDSAGNLSYLWLLLSSSVYFWCSAVLLWLILELLRFLKWDFMSFNSSGEFLPIGFWILYLFYF